MVLEQFIFESNFWNEEKFILSYSHTLNGSEISGASSDVFDGVWY